MARIYHLSFNWGAHLTRGRRRLTLEPDELATLADGVLIRAVPGRDLADPAALTAAVDVIWPDRPTLFDVLTVGQTRIVGPYSIYLRSVVLDGRWPDSVVIDVAELDYSEPDLDQEVTL